MIELAIKTAKEAGETLLKYYGNVNTMQKGEFFDSASILTQADLEAEKIILKNIKENFPSHNIYSEEAGGDITPKSEYTWYVDPLDGTGNFSRNIPLFGTSIAFFKDSRPILGVLYFPVQNLLVYAEKGKGSFANKKQIHVSNRNLRNSLYYSGGYYKGKLQLEKDISDKVGILKIIDVTSYELAHIAMGDAELYILSNIPHDIAAGLIIVEEAGGKVTDYFGNEWTLESEKVVISNGVIHDEVIKILNS